MTTTTTKPTTSKPATTSAIDEDLTRGSLPTLLDRYGGKAAWYVFALGLALFVLAPIVLFYSRAFGDGAAAVRNLTDVPNLATILFNTVVLAAGATVVAGVLAVALAVLVMRVPIRWRGFAAFLPQLGWSSLRWQPSSDGSSSSPRQWVTETPSCGAFRSWDG